jgi:hypothetical protein
MVFSPEMGEAAGIVAGSETRRKRNADGNSRPVARLTRPEAYL